MPVYASLSACQHFARRHGNRHEQRKSATSAAIQERSGCFGQRIADERARLSAEVTFAAAPEAFSFQVQTADTDVDASYSVEGAAVTTANATKVARVELMYPGHCWQG
ncbi:MAG TPA: hypothetical protein VGH37_12085 [Candidatus Acidoferrum sp.]